MTSCTVAVPDGWECSDDAHPTIAVLLCAAQSELAFTPNALVTVDNLDPGLTLRDWQRGTDLRLPATLTDYQLLDLERLDVAGAPGVRRLAHHTASGGHAVTMEQWAVVVGRSGYTLTATVPTFAYLEFTDVLADLVASWRIAAA